MANDIRLDSFPSNMMEGLTMLYLQNQDLTNVTPEDLTKLYWETYYRIRAAYSEHKDAAAKKWWS